MAERRYMNGHAWSDEYCPYKLSMQLKRRGYDEPSHSMYYTAVTHDGESISYDEELDLKGEGRGKEIVYVDGGAVWDTYNYNSEHRSAKVCSRPTMYEASRWLREEHGILISVDYDSLETRTYIYCITMVNDRGVKIIASRPKCYATYEEAFLSAVERAVKLVRTVKKQKKQ
jgi:hypothetical protein